MDELRYGVIGTGMMGVEHIETIDASPGSRVVAIADPDLRSRTAGASSAANEVQVFDDHRALLDADLCDAVVIATPNMSHLDVLRDVLATDLPVLVEKPLCTTVEDCRRAIAMAERRTGLVWVGLEYRYMPPVARLIDEVAAGATGPVRMIAIREHRYPFLAKVGDWNRLSRNTGGTLVEKCCHFFDLMNLLAASEPVRVMASGGQDVNHLDEVYGGERADILDNAFTIVEYASGARAVLDLCMFAEATHNQEEISVVGDLGKVEALVPEDVVRIGRRGQHGIGRVRSEHVGDASIAHVGYHHGATYVEHQRFAVAVRNGADPEVGLRDGLLSVAVGVAAHLSIDEQRAVSMSEVLCEPEPPGVSP